jgi:hypothetical protein
MSRQQEDMSMAGVMKEFQGLKDKLKGGEDEDGCEYHHGPQPAAASSWLALARFAATTAS